MMPCNNQTSNFPDHYRLFRFQWYAIDTTNTCIEAVEKRAAFFFFFLIQFFKVQQRNFFFLYIKNSLADGTCVGAKSENKKNIG